MIKALPGLFFVFEKNAAVYIWLSHIMGIGPFPLDSFNFPINVHAYMQNLSLLPYLAGALNQRTILTSAIIVSDGTQRSGRNKNGTLSWFMSVCRGRTATGKLFRRRRRRRRACSIDHCLIDDGHIISLPPPPPSCQQGI